MSATDNFSQLTDAVNQAQARAAGYYAEDAIDFAMAAVQQAQYAVLDTILARADADALAGK